MTLKQILGDLKLVWKKQKITLRPMGIIWQLFAFSFQPIWINKEDRPWFLWSPTIDRFRICVFDLHWHWNQFGGGQRDIWDAGGGNSMYHTALKWLVKLKIRTIEGFWSSCVVVDIWNVCSFKGLTFPCINGISLAMDIHMNHRRTFLGPYLLGGIWKKNIWARESTLHHKHHLIYMSVDYVSVCPCTSQRSLVDLASVTFEAFY